MSHDSDPLREQVEPCREISKHPVRLGAYPGQGVDHALYLIVTHGSQTATLAGHRLSPGESERGRGPDPSPPRAVGSEEVTRACKLTGLERIRVRSFHAMRRLLWLAMIAVGIQALMILTRPRLRRAILDRAKEFIPTVRFVAYRIWRVVQTDLRPGGSFASGHVVSAVAAVRASIAHPPALAQRRLEIPGPRNPLHAMTASSGGGKCALPIEHLPTPFETT
jgi:hypothetical protein